MSPLDWPPGHLRLAGNAGWAFPIAKDGRAWSRVVHWRAANLDALRASANVCSRGTWRRAWVEFLLDRFADELAAGATLGELADRPVAEVTAEPLRVMPGGRP
jgi:hypothetical protein